jgi:hypothetical protein
MRGNAFQNRDRLLTDRVFWVGAALYLALCIGAVAAFGDRISENAPEIIADMNSSGSLIFGDNALAPFGPNRFDFFTRAHAHRGAVTFRWHRFGSFSMEPNWSTNSSIIRNTAVVPLPEVSSTSATVTPPTTCLGASDGGTSALQIAFGEQSGFAAENIAPVPEPASWVAAALVFAAIGWSQRRRLARSFFGRRRRIGFFVSGALFTFAFNAFGTVSENFSQPGNLNWDLTGGSIADNDNFGAVQNLNQTINASTPFLTSVKLSDNQSLGVSGAPGETVTLLLKNFLMSGSSTFTLEGTATTRFVINVNKRFSLSDNARIILAGNTQWNNVTFNVRGSGRTIELSGSSTLTGILNASGRIVRLTDQALVNGQVIAKKLLVLDSAHVASPEQPPTP